MGVSDVDDSFSSAPRLAPYSLVVVVVVIVVVIIVVIVVGVVVVVVVVVVVCIQYTHYRWLSTCVE